MQEIFIEHNPSSSSFTNSSKKTFYLNVENVDLKSLCSIRSLFDIDRPLNDYRLFNTKESVAHYKAHVDAWKYIIDNNIKAAHIRDNTCSSSSSSSSSFSLEKDLKNIPWMKGDLFLLDYDELPDLGKEEEEEDNEDTKEKAAWYGLRNIFHGLNEYIITNQGARFLLRYAYPVEMRIDSFVGTLAHLYPSEFKILYLGSGKEKEKGKETGKNGKEKNKKRVVIHLRNNRLETPFLHNHPRHTRPSNPMSNIPMMILTFLFFGIFLLVIFLILSPSKKTRPMTTMVGDDDE